MNIDLSNPIVIIVGIILLASLFLNRHNAKSTEIEDVRFVKIITTEKGTGKRK